MPRIRHDLAEYQNSRLVPQGADLGLSVDLSSLLKISKGEMGRVDLISSENCLEVFGRVDGNYKAWVDEKLEEWV